MNVLNIHLILIYEMSGTDPPLNNYLNASDLRSFYHTKKWLIHLLTHYIIFLFVKEI